MVKDLSSTFPLIIIWDNMAKVEQYTDSDLLREFLKDWFSARSMDSDGILLKWTKTEGLYDAIRSNAKALHIFNVTVSQMSSYMLYVTWKKDNKGNTSDFRIDSKNVIS
jgi:hypothetical protein